MSKLQETAPKEIFLIVGPTDDTDFKELSDITWADKPVYEETAIKYVKQPKLSIPKKIADMLDEELKDSDDKLYTFNKCYEDLVLPYELLLQKNYAIICAHLAGKALGVELVEVTDE